MCEYAKDKDSFTGLQEVVVGYSKAPEQPQSSARAICHSHTMTCIGRKPATIHTHCCIQELAALRHCTTGDDVTCLPATMTMMDMLIESNFL